MNTKIEPTDEKHRIGDIQTLHLCDGLEDAVRCAEVLLAALVMTDFTEDADTSALNTYIYCIHEKVLNAHNIVKQLIRYLGH